MKLIKNILLMIVTLIGVKACFAVVSVVNETNERQFASASNPPVTRLPIPDTRAGYIRHGAGYGFSIELPQDWEILSSDTVGQIRDEADRRMGDDSSGSTRVTPLAANSDADPSARDAMVRVSIIDNMFVGRDIRSASQQDLSDICHEIYQGMLEAGGSVTRQPECEIATVSANVALQTRFEREGNASASTWTVTMYQIPLGEKMASLTISYRNDSPEARQVVGEALESVRIS